VPVPLLLRIPLSSIFWGFCRAYYFAVYVIEHYIDPGRKYAGLIDFVKCEKWTNFHQDQGLHILSKAVYVAIAVWG
jgi:hypothetical protein